MTQKTLRMLCHIR